MSKGISFLFQNGELGAEVTIRDRYTPRIRFAWWGLQRLIIFLGRSDEMGVVVGRPLIQLQCMVYQEHFCRFRDPPG